MRKSARLAITRTDNAVRFFSEIIDDGPVRLGWTAKQKGVDVKIVENFFENRDGTAGSVPLQIGVQKTEQSFAFFGQTSLNEFVLVFFKYSRQVFQTPEC